MERKMKDRNRRKPEQVNENVENIVEGKNPVIEALKSDTTVEKIFIAKGGEKEGPIKLIQALAKEKGVPVIEVDKKKLDDMSIIKVHQGVVAVISPYEYSTVDEILDYAKEKGEDPFVILLDEIEDPHNLGSIIRSANIFGAHGVIILKRRSALVTPTVIKASAGAAMHTKIAKVTNLTQTIKELKDRGLWIIGTDMDGEVSYRSNLKGPVGIVVGSEGRGMSRLVKENCDIIVKIPMQGQVNSLNASVAAGVIMYEVTRQRGI